MIDTLRLFGELKELIKLVIEHQETRKQLGGLTMAFGYSLENEAIKALPGLLERDHNILLKGRLKRQYMRDNQGNYIEANIISKGSRNGREVVIVSEGKSQLSKNDVNHFIKKN